MRPLVECVPNFSEGRRAEVVEAIAASLRAHPSVQLLDIESDADHNRSVFTLVAPPEAMVPAMFDAIKTAAMLIDLDRHTGEHPRIGATDVVPFVPLAGAEMNQCVALAKELGRRVGEELDIPVYLYEQAAARPDRVNLADIRRGEYEGLKSEIETDPNRKPDFGPSQVGPAGATVIGARPPLIAYNVFLTTDDVEIARRIARSIRNSNGGLCYVKALGLLVKGKAQVSMNLTDFRKTPIHQVVELIRREAARYGVTIESSELIGMIPQAALLDAAVWYLQLDNFEPGMVLENRLAD
jgi:glutamate formiminotransferase